ncbi:MAG: hypothetical protein CMJ23_13975 [Phycisphaerae bacterium]|nr:hypothetical protein [Phycisphaerae bacterium]
MRRDPEGDEVVISGSNQDASQSQSRDIRLKLLAHPDRLLGIQSGRFTPPILVDIDPVDGVCNLDCEWCCQAASRSSRPTKFMSEATMNRLGSFSRDWGVKSWRIAGDSEPLLHKGINTLIGSGSESEIDMGLITNGVYLERLTPDSLAKLDWLGISLDAGTGETWSRLKKSPASNFEKILDNIADVRSKAPTLDVAIKFLRWSSTEHLGKEDFGHGLLPVIEPSTTEADNSNDVEQVKEIAADLGVRAIIKNAYPRDFADKYRFTKCHATPLGGVFDASHTFHLCCDARGIFVLTDDYTRDDWQEMPRLWGGERHRELIDSIDPRKCVGCAKHAINEVLESHLIVGDRSEQLNFI